MHPRKCALARMMSGHLKMLICSGLLLAVPATASQAQQDLPKSSDAIANNLTDLFRTLTGAAKPPAKPTYKRTRFVIELERAAEFEVFSLVRPNRVVLQLPAMGMKLPDVSRQTQAEAGQLVTAVRAGQSGPKRTRIVIGVATPVVVENAHVVPHTDGGSAELRLDIVPLGVRMAFDKQSPQIATGVSSLGARGLQPPVPRKADSLHQRQERTHKYTIVVDPGHGGRDSGARKHGIREKNVVLAFGKMLRDKLSATGRYRVLMTRSTDRFITLRGRRAFAERNKADLFISVHADYASSDASGATIYSLRKRVAERLKKSAKKKVSRASLLTKGELKVLKASPASADAGALRKILTDLAWRHVEHTRFQTQAFSRTVIKHMGRSTEMRQRPHQTAAFRVLKTATMPAVLIELAYVSNRKDAARLRSRSWRDKVSSSIVRAVNNYFANVDRLPM